MNLTVHFVQPEFIQKFWPKVSKFLEDALSHGADEYTVEQLKVLLVRREQFLFVAVDELNEIHGAASVQFIDTPNYRSAFITAIGGRLISNVDTFNQLSEHFKTNGATRIQGAARESVERLWRRLFKFKRRYVIVEKEL